MPCNAARARNPSKPHGTPARPSLPRPASGQPWVAEGLRQRVDRCPQRPTPCRSNKVGRPCVSDPARASQQRFVADSGWIEFQIDQAEARAFCVVEYKPLAVVVHERPVGAFGTKRWQWLYPDLAAVTAHTRPPWVGAATVLRAPPGDLTFTSCQQCCSIFAALSCTHFSSVYGGQRLGCPAPTGDRYSNRGSGQLSAWLL